MEFKFLNLTKAYQDKLIFKKRDFVFKSGLTLFLGYNGTGKSTLLKLLAGVIEPTNQDYQKSALKVSYLAEKPVLSNGLVYPYLLSIKKLNHSKEDVKALMKTWEVPNKQIKVLSKGNKVKVAIIMMILAESDVYLFDEPTDSLDQKSIFLFTDYLKSLIKKDKICCVVTHEESYYESFKHEVLFFEA